MAEENIELPNNLENLLSPFCYESETSLPKTSPEVPGGMYLSGFISQDCTWGCCFNHSVIKCYPVDRYFEDQHTSFAAHSSNISVAVSSSSYTFVGGHITCATELAIHNLRTSSGMRKLLLGISYTGDNNKSFRGAVVLFDPIRCAPMKWIEIPEPVSSITVLSHFEEGGSNRPFFNETMMAMVGIAAVGLRGGSVIIIDLGLDDPNLSNTLASGSGNDSYLTYRLLNVNPHEYVIATKRHKAVSKRNLISLKFTNEPEDEFAGTDAFHYCKPNGESMMVVHKNSVAVTCLEYVPAIGSLLVGFTCGGFQIWRVNNMELQFSSEPVTLQREETAHVFGFSFQQPVDDPKNYCYIWVMYGNKSAECTSTHVELHSLLYERKNYIENFGFVYDEFKQCARRMSFPLMDDFLSTDSENEDFESIRGSARPVRIWTQPESDLMYCAWEVGRGGTFYLGAFDLNQWYSNHTREHIFYNPESGLCPYWVALPVEIPDVSNFVMDVRILPRSLMRWENPHAKLDVHLYPASVSFRAICMTNTGVYAFEHFGVQEKLVRIIIKDGASLMIQPENIKNSLTRYGLEPVFPHVYGEHLSQKDRDRYFILTVLLENRRTPAIICLANFWLDGSYANVGCTIDLIIDWIGGYMVALRNGADEHWHNLFDFADDTLPPETVRFINFSNFAWTSLHRLLMILMGPTEVYTVRRQELENMEFGLKKLVQYSAALLMMYKARLLPECERLFLRNLTDYYDQRRLEAKNALETCPYIDDQLRKTHPLMIDHLMDSLMDEEDLREEWHIEDRQHCYPPQHIGYLVNMFMLPDADPKAVSRVFMYFLIDLSLFSQNADASHHSDAVERKVRGDFKAVTDCSADEYQEIYDLWLLDHGFINEILVHFKESDRLYQKDGLPWCAAAVALTAAGYENDIADLLLKSCPPSLAKLLFSLMTSSNSKYTSLAELMISSNLGADEGLLEQFFEISETRERLPEFIRTKSKDLPQRVKSALLEFLNNTDSVTRMCQLLMYYVHTEDYRKLTEEFSRIRETLRHRNLSDTDRKTWKFQETYISQLLSTTKGSVVQQFLRRQNHQNVRSIHPVISIKAISAADTDDSPPKELPDRLRRDPKLPPHIRRLKLSESVVHDPLSPLRRYAGKIQNAVSGSLENDGGKEDNRSRRFSSRKSISRRISLSLSRHSLAINPNASLNETANATFRNSHIDLISLLKTPTVDHRIENRQSFNNLSQIVPHGQVDEGISHPAEPPRHSIMKETDPSKPKVSKKVELRFENLSLSSEECDERNATIYEDADENLEDGDGKNLTNAVFEASFNSADDKSLFENETVRDLDFQETDYGLEEDADQIIAPPHDASSSVTPPGTTDQDTNPTGGIHESVTSRPKSKELSPVRTQRQKTPIVEVSSEEVHKRENLSDTKVYTTEEYEEGSNLRRKARSKTPTQDVSMEQDHDDESKNQSIDESILQGAGDDGSRHSTSQIYLIEPQSEGASPPRRAKRETRASKTTSREVSPEDVNKSALLSDAKVNETEEKVEARKKRRKIRGSRTSTPTPDNSMDQDDETEKQATLQVHGEDDDKGCITPTKDIELKSGDNSPATSSRRVTRASRTPSRDVSIDEVNKSESLSDTKLNETEENDEDRSVRRKTRVSRSRTPTRDIPVDQEEDTEAQTFTRRTLRATRSTTPTREAQIIESDDSSLKSSRRSTRSTRSKTPTRDTEPQSEGVSPARTSKRETRASRTPSRDVSTDEINKSENLSDTIVNEAEDNEEDTNVRRKTRVSRSRTPTRDVPVEPEDEPEKQTPIRRSLRATRSTTPTREAQITELDDTIAKSTRRSTRSTRSKTPTRELELQTEDLPPTGTSRQDSAASKVPSDIASTDEISKKLRRSSRTSLSSTMKELFEDDEENEEDRNVRRKTRVSRSRTPTRDVSVEPEDEPERRPSTRRTLRAVRSTTPTREASNAEFDDSTSSTKSTKRSTRSTRSKTPTRDSEFQSEELSPTKISKRETRASKTPSREVLTDELNKSEELSGAKIAKTSGKSGIKSLVTPEPPSSSSFVFEITQEDLEEDMEESEEVPIPTTSSKTKAETMSKARKRRLKFLHHHQDLSTVIEDPETDRSEISVFEATIQQNPPKAEPPKKRRIKGIKARPVEEEPPPELPKPTKRRKAAILDDFEEEDEQEIESTVSSRSTRSASSRRSASSTTKAKTSRRKGRTSSKSTT